MCTINEMEADVAFFKVLYNDIPDGAERNTEL